MQSIQRQLLENSLRFTELHRGRVRREGGLIHLDSAEPDFRCTLVERLDAEIPEAIHTVRTLPWAGAVGPALKAQGFQPRGKLRYLRLNAALPVPVTDLSVTRVIDPYQLTAFSEVQTRSFLLPNESFAQWFRFLDDANRSNLGDPEQSFWVGALEGRAVCAAHVMRTGAVAGLYAVATLPGFRRRGFSRALAGRAIAESTAAGAEIITLQVYSDSPAEALYLKLGFVLEFDAEVWTRS